MRRKRTTEPELRLEELDVARDNERRDVEANRHDEVIGRILLLRGFQQARKQDGSRLLQRVV